MLGSDLKPVMSRMCAFWSQPTSSQIAYSVLVIQSIISSAQSDLEDTYGDEKHALNHEHHKQETTTESSTTKGNKNQKASHKEQNTTSDQSSRATSDQPTLQHDSSLDYGDLDRANHGDIISIHGPSHKGPITPSTRWPSQRISIEQYTNDLVCILFCF